MKETRSDGKVLVWELKTDGSAADGTDQDLQDKDYGYSWGTGGAASGPAASNLIQGTTCSGIATCDTAAYVAKFNTDNKCGSNKWRLPTQDELLGLTSTTKTGDAYINSNFVITNTWPDSDLAVSYWSSTASGTNKVAISYTTNTVATQVKTQHPSTVNFVRLVHD
jgi:hypothetical protein